MIVIREAWGEEETLGYNSRGRFPYIILGTTSRVEARSALYGYVPKILVTTGLYLQEISVKERAGTDIWDGEAVYGTVKPPEPADWQYEFDISAQTQKIDTSLETVAAYGPDATVDDFAGLIGVRKDGDPEGCEIFVPQMKWTELHQIPKTIVTWEYVDILNALTGMVNASPFRGRGARTVLFAGCSGRRSSRNPDWFDCNFSFWYSRNMTRTMEILGQNYNIEKSAWDYFWVYSDFVGDPTINKRVKRPEAAYVERVYWEGDFSLLGIGTGVPTS